MLNVIKVVASFNHLFPKIQGFCVLYKYYVLCHTMNNVLFLYFFNIEYKLKY